MTTQTARNIVLYHFYGVCSSNVIEDEEHGNILLLVEMILSFKNSCDRLPACGMGIIHVD